VIIPVRKKTLAEFLRRCLENESEIEIDGIGKFELKDDEVMFRPGKKLRVFLAYAVEDRYYVKKLYHALQSAGLEPWMDSENLLPGQNWPRAIERAIERSDFFISCFSRRSVVKRGSFQSELRYALGVAASVPLEDVYLIPVRLDQCQVPRQISVRTQYIDLFPDWDAGVKKLVNVMVSEATKHGKDGGIPVPQN
jgi:TIR domain